MLKTASEAFPDLDSLCGPDLSQQFLFLMIERRVYTGVNDLDRPVVQSLPAEGTRERLSLTVLAAAAMVALLALGFV